MTEHEEFAATPQTAPEATPAPPSPAAPLPPPLPAPPEISPTPRATGWGATPPPQPQRPRSKWRRPPGTRRRPWRSLAVMLVALGAIGWFVQTGQSTLGGSEDPNATAVVDTGTIGPALPGWDAVPPDFDPTVGRQALASVGKVIGPRGMGSGWIARRGVVITNNHVVQFAGTPLRFAINGGPTVDCQLIGRTRSEEIAALSCPTGTRPPLRIWTGPVDLDVPLLTLGYPAGTDVVVLSSGRVTEERRMIDEIPALGTSAHGAPGSSGSPMVDAYGRVFGMVTWGSDADGRVLGVRVTDVQPIVTDPDGFGNLHGADTRTRLLWAGGFAAAGCLLGAWTRYRSGYGGVLRRAAWLAASMGVVGLLIAQLSLFLRDPSAWM